MKATYIEHMGSDLTVVNAARVSFAKQSEFEQILVECPARDSGYMDSRRLKESDVKLIKYLAKHNHWTPFGHCQAQIHVKAPIFVARQLVKHQVGLVWNEVSRRYVSDTPEFWWPEQWRLKAENKKQGSSDEVLYGSDAKLMNFDCIEFQQQVVKLYLEMLDKNIAPELARIVLPVNMYTEWYWTGSLAAWARVCKLRLDPHAQYECQLVARDIADIMAAKFPVSWAALMEVNDE